MAAPMNKPAQSSHQLSVQTAAGTAYYTVDEARKLEDGASVVTNQAGDWLDMGEYEATYVVFLIM